MIPPKKNLAPLALVTILLALAVACGETGKANQLIEEGNKLVQEGNQIFQDTQPKAEQVFNSAEGFPDNQASLKPDAQAAADGFDKSASKLRDAAKKFEEASRLKIDDKFKEYLTLKAKEFNKHAEQVDVLKSMVAAFNEAGDLDSLNAKMTRGKEQAEKLDTEWRDYAAQAEKVREQNKDKFQS